MNGFDYYEISNIIGSAIVPGSVHMTDNKTAAYFARYLLEKAISVFKWENIPPTWNKDYFLYVLYVMGYIAVIPTDKYGVIPQRGTLGGYDVFYAPAYITIANPLLETRQYNIINDAECTLIKLQGNYNGVWDMVSYYAGKMALAAEAIDMNLINSKTAKIFFSKNKAAAETMKKVYDKVSSGDPAVVSDRELLDENGKLTWEWFSDNLKQNYIASDVLIDLRKLENEFCTDLGIANTNTDKRERLTTDEVNANNEETYTRADLWLERLKDGVERTNKKYGLEIKVDWRSNPHERNSVNTGDVGRTPDIVR